MAPDVVMHIAFMAMIGDTQAVVVSVKLMGARLIELG